MPKYEVQDNQTGKSYILEGDSPPTEQELHDIFAQQNQPQVQPQEQKPAAEQPAEGGSVGTALGGMAIETGAGLAGAALGGIAGGVIGTAVAPAAGTAAGAAYGAAIGGAAMSAFGNWLKQQLEIHTGERKEVKGGEMVASAILGAVPAGLGAKAIAKSTGLAKPALIRAAQGGSAAAAAKLAEITIDEGKLPDVQRVATDVVPQAVMGGVLGGALGAVEKRYQMKGGLIVNPVVAQGLGAAAGLGTAAYVYNDAVEKGESNPLAKATLYGAGVYGATRLPSKLAKIDSKRAVEAIFGPEAVTPSDVLEVIRATPNELAGRKAEATMIANAVNEAISKSKNPQELTAQVLEAYGNNKPIGHLPEDIQTYVQRFRQLREDNTQELLTRYGDQLSEAQKKGIEANKSSYVRTAYAAHDPRAEMFVDYATPEATEAFKKQLMSKGMSESAAENTMARMRGDIAYVYSGGMDGKKTSPTSAFMRKGDLTPEAKAYLGEIKDPGRVIEQTISTQAKLILDDQRDEQVLKLLKQQGLASHPSDPNGILAGHDTLLIGADSPTYHSKMANVQVPKYIADAYKELMSPNLFGKGDVAKGWLAMAGLSKATKTVGNLAESVTPQIVGNIALAASGLKANPVDIYHSALELLQMNGWKGGSISAQTKTQLASQARELIGLGVMKGGADIQELNNFLRLSAEGKDWRSVMNKMSDIYGFPDSVVRYAVYKQNLKEQMSFGLGLGADELKKRAAKITNDTFPTYELIPRRYRQLSAATVANVFGAFEFEVMRNSMNQIKIAGQMLREGQATGNQAMMKAGGKRLLAFATMGGITAGLAVTGSRLLGTSQEDQENLQKIIPPFDSDKANAYQLQDGTGKFSYTPMNYLFPHANMLGAINEGINGRNPLPYLKTSLMGNDLGPLATAGIESITNTYYGTKIPISEPRDPKELTERFLSRAFMPNIIVGTGERIRKAITGETNKLGSSPTLGDVGLRTLGYRQNTYDILGSATTRIRDINDPITGELTGYRQILKKAQIQPNGLSRLNEEAIYQQRAQGYSEGQDKLREIYVALKGLQKRAGYSDNEIISAFRQAGVPNRLILAATMGYKEPMPRGLAESNSDIINEIVKSESGKKDPIGAIMARSGGDMSKAKQLVEAYRTTLVTDARGGDAYTKLFGGLNVSDGERARAISASLASTRAQYGDEAAKKLYEKLVSTKVLTKEVARQMMESRQ